MKFATLSLLYLVATAGFIASQEEILSSVPGALRNGNREAKTIDKKWVKLIKPPVLQTEVCTPPGVSIECRHSACKEFVAGSCFEITELFQSLIPDMRECYAENYPELVDAALLWNERSMSGIPAIAAAEGVGTIEGKHMQIDIALMFDHWDIVDKAIGDILATNPDDVHALFVKAMYGFEGVLPNVDPPEVLGIIAHLDIVSPNAAKLVDRTLAEVKRVWFKEFLHPLYGPDKYICEIGMDGDVTGMLFNNFECKAIAEEFHPSKIAILVFGANNENIINARVAVAKNLADRFPHAVILATGGALDTDRAEGDLILEAMPEYADRIIVDRQARDTIGNSLAIAEYLKQNDIDILLSVSSTFHLTRATMALRGVLQRKGLQDTKSYMVGAGNHVQALFPDEWNQDNQDWLEISNGGGRFCTNEIPMTNRDFARGAGYFTMCDFETL